MATETELLERLRAGDGSAFAEAVRLYNGAMLRAARALLGDHDAAEDACQDAWLSAMRGITSFEERSSLRTWLTRIVINEAKMRLRRSGRETSIEVIGTDADPFAGRFADDGHWSIAPLSWRFHGPEDLLSEADLRRCIENTLEKLPANQRMVIEMCDLEGMSPQEVCNALGVGASNLRVLLHRARSRMFGMIEHYSETGKC